MKAALPKSVRGALAAKWTAAFLVLCAISACAWISYREGNEEFVYLFGGLLTALLLSALFSGLLRLAFDPSAPEGGAICPPWVPWFVRIAIRWTDGREGRANGELPADVALECGKESVSFRTRMSISAVRRMVRWSDPTGLFNWSRCGTIPQPARHDPVPRKGILQKIFYDASEGDLESPSGKQEGDLTDTRFYQTGDSARRILWSVVARQGGLARAGDRLMVRSEERVTSRRAAIFFLPGGEDEAAAGFTRSCLENALLGGDWVFSTTGCKEPLRRVKDDKGRFLEVIDSTTVPSPVWEQSLAEFNSFSKRMRASGVQTLFVIVSAPFLAEDPVRESLIMAADRGARILAVVAGEGGGYSFSSSQTKVVGTEVVS